MKFDRPDRAGWLEIGVGVFALSLLVGTALLVLGRSGDRLQSHSREAEGPAAPGTIPAERHKNISTVAAR